MLHRQDSEERKDEMMTTGAKHYPKGLLTRHNPNLPAAFFPYYQDWPLKSQILNYRIWLRRRVMKSYLFVTFATFRLL
jgi:hypothetical protein